MVKFNILVAVCEGNGISKENDLPWDLPGDVEHVHKLSTATQEKNKKNVVIIGRKFWDLVPEEEKPFYDRFNFILTKQKDLDLSKYENTCVFNNWEDILNKLEDPEFKDKYENIWIFGGAQIYEQALNSKYFYRLYITRVKKFFECDVHFPKLIEHIKRVEDDNVPQGIQEENGIQWEVEVYETTKTLE